MLKFLKKKQCSNCGKQTRRRTNYAGYDICSEQCMVDLFANLTTDELIKLDGIDRFMTTK